MFQRLKIAKILNPMALGLVKFLTPVLIFLISVELLMRITALILTPDNKTNFDKRYSILALGESTTQKQMDGSDWPNQLQKLLNQNFKAAVYNEGLAATATTAILTKVPRYIQHYRPKLIITMMGINDSGNFWPKKFVVSDPSDPWHQIKIYKLFRYLSAEIKELSRTESRWVLPNITYDSLKYPEYKKLIASLNREKYKSASYNASLNKIEEFLIGKADLEKAQFYASVAKDINPVFPEKDFNLHKKLDFYLLTSKHDIRVNDAANYAMHFAITTNQLKYCREIIEAARKARIHMNETFLIRAASCLQDSKDEVAKLFKEAGDIYEYRDDDKTPTVENYLTLAGYIEAEGICWIAMEYPNREFSEPLKAVMSLGSKHIFLLSNHQVFQDALKRHSVDEIFIDNFGEVFGHATRFGNSLIANNVFQLIENLRKNNLCGL